MISFDNYGSARAFIQERVDKPALEYSEALGNLVLHTFSQELEEKGTFTNIYDLSFPAGAAQPQIDLHNKLTSVFDYVTNSGQTVGAMGGGFFFLADRASQSPRQLALNLALANGQIHSLPVVDRETITTDGQNLRAEYAQSLGVMTINGTDVS